MAGVVGSFPSTYMANARAEGGGDTLTIIDDAADRWGLPRGRFECIAWYESRYDPSAIGHDRTGSNYGLYQFIPGTGLFAFAAVGSDFWSAWDDPYWNTEAAAWLYTVYGPTQWAVVVHGLC